MMPIFHADEGESTTVDRIIVCIPIVLYIIWATLRSGHGAPASVLIARGLGASLTPSLLFVCVYFAADWIGKSNAVVKWIIYAGLCGIVAYYLPPIF